MEHARKLSWWLIAGLSSVVTAMVALGFWQLDRAEHKRIILRAYANITEPMDITRSNVNDIPRFGLVTARGRYWSDRQIIMDGMSSAQQGGYMVLTPFQMEHSGKVILVNRGWRPWQTERHMIDDIDVQEEIRVVRGRLDRVWKPGLILGAGNEMEKNQWPQLSVYPQIDEMSQWLDTELVPRQVLLLPTEIDGFKREWRPTGVTPERHIGYAFQWFAMSSALIVLVVVAYVKNRRETRG